MEKIQKGCRPKPAPLQRHSYGVKTPKMRAKERSFRSFCCCCRYSLPWKCAPFFQNSGVIITPKCGTVKRKMVFAGKCGGSARHGLFSGCFRSVWLAVKCREWREAVPPPRHRSQILRYSHTVRRFAAHIRWRSNDLPCPRSRSFSAEYCPSALFSRA